MIIAVEVTYSRCRFLVTHPSPLLDPPPHHLPSAAAADTATADDTATAAATATATATAPPPRCLLTSPPQNLLPVQDAGCRPLPEDVPLLEWKFGSNRAPPARSRRVRVRRRLGLARRG